MHILLVGRHGWAGCRDADGKVRSAIFGGLVGVVDRFKQGKGGGDGGDGGEGGWEAPSCTLNSYVIDYFPLYLLLIMSFRVFVVSPLVGARPPWWSSGERILVRVRSPTLDTHESLLVNATPALWPAVGCRLASSERSVMAPVCSGFVVGCLVRKIRKRLAREGRGAKGSSGGNRTSLPVTRS